MTNLTNPFGTVESTYTYEGFGNTLEEIEQVENRYRWVKLHI